MFQSVPECSKEEDGNNVTSSSSPNPIYKYDFVLNNYTDKEVCQVKLTLQRICKKAVFGFEIGEDCGTPHLQGYMSLIRKQRITGLAKEPGFARVSFRAVRNEPALIDYCMKDGNYWSHGFPRPIQVIETLRPWQKDAEALLTASSYDDRTVYWYHEEKGKVGKSAFAKYMVVKHKALYCSSGKYADIINLVFNSNMDTCECVIFDIPRHQGNNVSYAAIESIKNGLICNTKYETGTKVFNSPRVIVFSNFEPEKSNLSEDRWAITHIGGEVKSEE